MKTLLIIGLLLIATTSFAKEEKEAVSIKPVKPIEISQTACTDTGLNLLQKDELEKRGCCSHHGGVCGCSGGRVVCCDDTYSPSCACKTDDKPVKDK